MRPFLYARPGSVPAALRAFAGGPAAPVQGRGSTEYLVGGTTLLDLMKLDVMQPAQLVDLGGIATAHSGIEVDSSGVRLGAFARMSAVADHPGVLKAYPVLAQSLMLAASAQLRNMASLGGNVLQRTRCTYFRDLAWTACNKRAPGSGCAAREGFNRQHAILGVSQDCIAAYPGDWAQALVALDATVDLAGPAGARTITFATLHRMPGTTPEVETSLRPGEIIVSFFVPAGPWTRRSLYLKVRDRESYEFALASAAVALDLDGGTVREARIALGGVATVPWRAREAEAALAGRRLDEAAATQAAALAFRDATLQAHNAYKSALGQSTLVRALLQAATMEI